MVFELVQLQIAAKQIQQETIFVMIRVIECRIRYHFIYGIFANLAQSFFFKILLKPHQKFRSHCYWHDFQIWEQYRNLRIVGVIKGLLLHSLLFL